MLEEIDNMTWSEKMRRFIMVHKITEEYFVREWKIRFLRAIKDAGCLK